MLEQLAVVVSVTVMVIVTRRPDMVLVLRNTMIGIEQVDGAIRRQLAEVAQEDILVTVVTVGQTVLVLRVPVVEVVAEVAY